MLSSTWSGWSPGHAKTSGSTEDAPRYRTRAPSGRRSSTSPTAIRLPRVPGSLQAVEREGWRGDHDGGRTGLPEPATLSAKTFTLIAFHEMENAEKPGGVESAFVMQRCLHCLEPACVSACPTTALYHQADGPVLYNVDDCIGCRYCQLACPLGRADRRMESRAPQISKCTHCADRIPQPARLTFNGQALSDAAKRFADTMAIPACVKACPADALRYGTREEMLALAHKRIADRPDR